MGPFLHINKINLKNLNSIRLPVMIGATVLSSFQFKINIIVVIIVNFTAQCRFTMVNDGI